MIDRFFCLGSGVALGCVASFVALPKIDFDSNCLVRTIERRPVVSYVLKPPFQEPVVLRQSCPEPQVQNASSAEIVKETADEGEPPRHRRHHRRRHWR